jgi:hypothetical protein
MNLMESVMDELKCFTVSCYEPNGPRAVAGVTFRMKRLDDGRFVVEPKGASERPVELDVELLTSKYAILRGDEVTLTRVGLKRSEHGARVLVVPKLSDAPYIPGLTGVCTPSLIWLPEDNLQAMERPEPNYRECLMRDLWMLRVMTPLWVERCGAGWGGNSARIESHGNFASVETGGRRYTSRLE